MLGTDGLSKFCANGAVLGRNLYLLYFGDQHLNSFNTAENLIEANS